MITKLHLSHTPTTLPVFITVFRSVTNASFLKSQLLASNQAFNYAFIDGSTILSRRHILAAIFRALNDHVHDRLKSNNVHSEIVFCLSANNNIGDAFRRFGIQDETRDLVVVKVGDSPTTSTTESTAGAGVDVEVTEDSVQAHLASVVEGKQVAFDGDDEEVFVQMCDLERVRRVYKLGNGSANAKGRQKVVNGDGAGNPALSEREEVEVQVLGLMALRGAT